LVQEELVDLLEVVPHQMALLALVRYLDPFQLLVAVVEMEMLHPQHQMAALEEADPHKTVPQELLLLVKEMLVGQEEVGMGVEAGAALEEQVLTDIIMILEVWEAPV
jgi:hypothetical protein